MKSTVNILAAAATVVLCGLSTAKVAEAGGTRLQFGFPLGSFTTRPSGYGGGHSSYAHGGGGHNYAAQKRAVAAAEARKAAARARQQAIAEAKRDAAARVRAEALAEAREEARREKLAEERAEARRLARLAEARRDNDEEAEETTVKTASLAPDAAPIPVRRADTVGDVAIGEPKVVLSARDEPVAEAKTIKSAKADAPRRSIDCKRFVPSAGLTITVPCAE